MASMGIDEDFESVFVQYMDPEGLPFRLGTQQTQQGFQGNGPTIVSSAPIEPLNHLQN